MPAQGAIIIIPARYGSTRFPGKPLAKIGGVPMILRVLEGARAVRGADDVLVATDDRRIARVVEDAGGKAVMTSRAHKSGTSRVREAAMSGKHGIIVNIQGDEPLVPRRGIERMIEEMASDRSVRMATLAAADKDPRAFRDPDVVKVVAGRDGYALYFSRSPVPHAEGPFLRHIGVYGYRRKFLLEFTSMPQGPLEKREKLEQLRALENGFRIKLVMCREKSVGVDRPEDIKRVEKSFKSY
jgi:3-deoxy-manno-octulosonate cytidylyltransferase (CMP-KDO synthetase)